MITFNDLLDEIGLFSTIIDKRSKLKRLKCISIINDQLEVSKYRGVFYGGRMTLYDYTDKNDRFEIFNLIVNEDLLCILGIEDADTQYFMRAGQFLYSSEGTMITGKFPSTEEEQFKMLLTNPYEYNLLCNQHLNVHTNVQVVAITTCHIEYIHNLFVSINNEIGRV